MTINTAPKPAAPAPLTSHGAAPLSGVFALPGDAAIAQAALALGALTVGRSTLEGVPDTAALLALMAALRQLGVRIERQGDCWQLDGLGVGGLLAPATPLVLAQAPNAAPLVLGLLACHDFPVQVQGVPAAELATTLGVALDTDGDMVTLRGSATLPPLQASVASATTKAALLLTAVQRAGISTIVEPAPTHDHMEILLAAFGGAVTVNSDAAGVTRISVTGLTPLTPAHVMVPGDPGLAAYPLVAGLIVPGSDVLIEQVLINPTRTGMIDTLLEMGGDIQFLNQQQRHGEHLADLRVRSSRLKGVRISAEHTAAMQDDIAVLAVAAAYAQGETVIEGLAEAQLDAILDGLVANGIAARAAAGQLSIVGAGAVTGGGRALSQGDPRMAMSFLLLGLASAQPVTIDDAGSIDAIFPGFGAAMRAAGANFEPDQGVLP